MLPGDELIVDVNDDSPFGHKARQRMMEKARGQFLWFLDDDDLVSKNALTEIRTAIAKGKPRLHIFKLLMREKAEGLGVFLWRDKQVCEGNISTQMIVAPNIPELGHWGEGYEGDWEFVRSTTSNLKVNFEEAVIAYRNGAAVRRNATDFELNGVKSVGRHLGVT
jgi:hypothetical protein